MSRFIGWAFFGNGVVVLKDPDEYVNKYILWSVVNAAQGM